MSKTTAGEFVVAVVALTALCVGTSVYLFDRDPAHVAFLAGWLQASLSPRSEVFGALGGSLPAFLHTLAFTLLTALAFGATARAATAAALIWWGIETLFELGQHPVAGDLIAAALPAWFAYTPVLDAMGPYFARSTFDFLDLVAVAAGAVSARLIHFHLIRENCPHGER